MSDTIFRVHPSINVARVGSSEEYYIAPETAAGELLDTERYPASLGVFGGLPIKAGTEDELIEEADLRDDQDKPKRQAARFRIYAYDNEQSTYPSEDKGREVNIGDAINGKTVKDIIWTVHLANKKTNNFEISSGPELGEEGVDAYKDNKTPPIRNKHFGALLSSADRRKKLVIDAGPRTISALEQQNQKIEFDANTTCTYADDKGQRHTQANYPVSFPKQHFDDLLDPLGSIDTLGQLMVEPNGRLLVAGGYGKASGIIIDGNPPALDDAIDNNNWFDDTSDGPVNAVVIFEDGTTAEVVGGWVTTTDPSYAPQTRNVVSTWDDVYSAWVEDSSLGFKDDLYKNGAYQSDYEAAFDQDILPVFHGAFLQAWNTNLPKKAHDGHKMVANIKPSDDPKAKIPNLKALLRNPNNSEEDTVQTKMPLALGDAKRSFLSLSKTQYFLMTQWYDGKSKAEGSKLGDGERLDKAVLENCLGGRYSPGIDFTFIVRDINLYKQAWQGKTGPFRINEQSLDYSKANASEPFLSTGYTPLRSTAVEPGDICKFMALPWHTDYNSCAVHEPDPKVKNANTLYWSWPAQRPVQVFPKHTCTYDSETGKWNRGDKQVFSVRGTDGHGSSTDYPQREGRYQCYFDFLENWEKVGFIIQGTQIPDAYGNHYGADKYLEVASLFESDGDNVGVWPTSTIVAPNGEDKPIGCPPKKTT